MKYNRIIPNALPYFISSLKSSDNFLLTITNEPITENNHENNEIIHPLALIGSSNDQMRQSKYKGYKIVEYFNKWLMVCFANHSRY